MPYVMVVDDDKDFTDAVSKVMRDSGYEVKAFNDTNEVMESVEERMPDIIILDVMFPEDSSAGFDFARNMRNNKYFRDIPILMLTAVNKMYPFGFDKRDIDDQWMPVTDFLEKPIDFNVLRTKVSTLLEKKISNS